MDVKIDLKGKALDELERLFVGEGKERYRARQLFRWVYRRLEKEFSDMSDLSKQFRRELEQHYYVSRFTPLVTRISKDKTVKFLFPLDNGDGVESVLIPEGRRNTICLSTQGGCKMGCAFCAARDGGFSRNLTAAEIVNQYCYGEEFLRQRGEVITNVVFMGMGEPLDNLNELIRAVKIINSELSFGISGKRITVSTCGLIPEMKRLLSECNVSLAISLNATTDSMRSDLMPINRKYPLHDLLEFLRNVEVKRNRKITVEYLLIKGVNDGPDDAMRLAQFLQKSRIKVNLIPYNATPGNMFEPPEDTFVEMFRHILGRSGIQAIIRDKRGTDIEAGCGQLRGQFQGRKKSS